MKKILTLSFFILPLLYFSQDYKSAIGVKSGMPGIAGINAKLYAGNQFWAFDNTLGVNFDADNRYLSAQVLFEYNRPFGLNEGYNWYAGVGPTAQYYLRGGYIQEDLIQLPEKFFLSADGVFGLEYSAPRTKFNAAIEGGPYFTFLPMIKVGGFFNVAVRYRIK